MQEGEGRKAPAAGPARPPVARWPGRARGLLACAAAVLLLHASLLARLGDSLRFGSEAEPTGAAVRLRTLAPPEAAAEVPGEPGPDAQSTPAELVDAGAAGAGPAARDAPSPARPMKPARQRLPEVAQADAASAASAAVAAPAASAAANARSVAATPPAGEGNAAASDVAAGSSSAASAINASAPPFTSAPPFAAASAASEPINAAAAAAAAAGSASAPPMLLAEGEAAPPVYATRLPPAATLRYEVRRGFLRGTGEIRWQPAGNTYTLSLDARIAGLSLLTQTSSGSIDASGLAPERFVDQRARRPLQAANFRRDIERITFSGPAVQWPLLAGSQDRLSWLIQLAGIAAARPELLVEGGSIAMVVVGARGDAAVWTLRVAGSEDIDTAAGSVRAVKLVSRGRGVAGTSAEVWLDPAHGWLPAHATLRNAAGASEYDLLLERIEPGS